MRWVKLGRVHSPDGSIEWMNSHAYVPTPHVLDDETIRVYVAFLDRDLVGRVGFVDVEAADPLRVKRISEQPALDVGEIGAFDEHGVTPTALVPDGARLRLYYFGWQRAVNVPYLLFAGLAASEDGGETFSRVSRVPVLPSVDGERVCRSAPSVLRSGEGEWRAWYVAADAWTELDGRPVPTYEIRTISSADGVQWGGQGRTAIALANEDEIGLGRPFFHASTGGHQLWYSVRSRSLGYRIGYASSSDGTLWTRHDEEAGIDVSRGGWDSEMVCFGAVQPTSYGTYLFYNGNGYGETGFGVAVLDS